MAFKAYPKILSINIEAKDDDGAFVEVTFEEEYASFESHDWGKDPLLSLGPIDLARWQVAIEFTDGNVVVYG